MVGVTPIKELKVHPPTPSSPSPVVATTVSRSPWPLRSRSTPELLMAKGGGINEIQRNRQPGARSSFKDAVTVASVAAVGGM